MHRVAALLDRWWLGTTMVPSMPTISTTPHDSIASQARGLLFFRLLPYPFTIYAEAARAAGHIVESGPELEAAARILAGKPAMKLTGHDGREA